MEIISRISTATHRDEIIKDLLPDGGEAFDFAFFFISFFNKETILEISTLLQKKLKVKNFLGCSCAGVIGTYNEVEQQPACSLILAKLGNVTVNPFSLNQEDLGSMARPEDWYDFFDVYPNEKPKFLTLCDPFLMDTNQFLDGVNNAYPQCPVVGGIASAASAPRGNVLILNGKFYDEGAVGVHMTGNVRIDTIVSQGCRPIGENYIVTKAQGNIIYELAGSPFLKVLEDVLNKSPQRDRTLAKEAIFVGIAMNEYKHEMKRGDFLIRMLVGIDEKSGAGAIADYIHSGQTIQFHVRDAVSATEDLNELLRLQHHKNPQMNPAGALIFSCNGRGQNLFKEKNHDIGIIQGQIGGVPGAGFFCAGEIGPVGGKNFIHGFTSSIALFYPL